MASLLCAFAIDNTHTEMEHHILSGTLSLERLLTQISLQHPRDFYQKYRWLLDFRQAKLDVSPEEIRALGRFAQEYRRRHPEPEIYKMAAIAADDVTFGLFRSFMVYADCENTRLYVTRSPTDALAWLESDQPSTPKPTLSYRY